MTTTKKLDAESVLRQLAVMRRSIPFLPSDPPRVAVSEDRRTADCITMEDFEYAAVADGLQSLADELGAALDHAQEVATQKALEIYWTTEELARDPAHAELIPHVEKMRAAYIADHGVPPPPRST